MKKISILTITLIGIVSSKGQSAPSYVGDTNATHTVGARIFSPLAVQQNQMLSFGAIIPSATDTGTVTIDPDWEYGDEIQTTGGIVYGGENASAGSILITGDSGYVRINSNPPSVLTNEDDSSVTMALSGMRLSGQEGTGDAEEIRYTIGSDRQISVGSGGTLTIAPNQASGYYSAEWPIVVFY